MIKFLTLVSLVCLMTLPVTVMSAENTIDQNQMLSELKLEKMQAETMVETMVKSGRLTATEGDKARRAIASVHVDDMEQILDTKEQVIVHMNKHDVANN